MAITAALDEFSLDPESPAWRDLMALSTTTRVESIDVVPEGVFGTNTEFSAVATIYVDMNGGDDEEGRLPESFPAYVKGHFQDGDRQEKKAVIESVTIDTSSFYD
jgi:hypothetical protein